MRSGDHRGIGAVAVRVAEGEASAVAAHGRRVERVDAHDSLELAEKDEISDPGEIVLFPRSEADCQAFLVSQMRLNDELTEALDALERRKLLNLLFPSRTFLALTSHNAP